MQDGISMICDYEKERNRNLLKYPGLIRERMNFRLPISRCPFFWKEKERENPSAPPQKLNIDTKNGLI